MAHYKTAILFITWYYTLKEVCTSFLSSCTTFFRHVRSYNNNNWLIFPGHALPQSYSITPIHGSWIYNVAQQTLHPVHSDEDCIRCKLSWLSVKLVVIRKESQRHEEYDMDSFFQQCRVYTYDSINVSLHDLFMAWCIATSHWFPITDTIQFHLIDHLGEERTIPLTHAIVFEVRENKLYDRAS